MPFSGLFLYLIRTYFCFYHAFYQQFGKNCQKSTKKTALDLCCFSRMLTSCVIRGSSYLQAVLHKNHRLLTKGLHNLQELCTLLPLHNPKITMSLHFYHGS